MKQMIEIVDVLGREILDSRGTSQFFLRKTSIVI